MVNEQARRKIVTNQGGVSQQTDVSSALFLSIFNTAVKGSPHSQRLAMELISAADTFKHQQLTQQIETSEKIKSIQQTLLAEAKSKNADTRLILPHPDDIVIHEQAGVSVVGPIDKDELRTIETCLQLRETLLLQDALDQRLLEPDEGETTACCMAFILIRIVNQYLPVRFRWNDAEMSHYSVKAEGHSKRDLLKLTHQGWKNSGASKPRGYTSPRYADLV